MRPIASTTCGRPTSGSTARSSPERSPRTITTKSASRARIARTTARSKRRSSSPLFDDDHRLLVEREQLAVRAPQLAKLDAVTALGGAQARAIRERRIGIAGQAERLTERLKRERDRRHRPRRFLDHEQ